MSAEINEVTTEQQTPKRGRPRKISLNDDAGLLDESLKIQRTIMNDAKANSATRQRAADSVAELIKTRTAGRDDLAKAALKAEITRLQSEVSALTQQVEDQNRSALGKIDASEAATMRSELARLRSEAQTFADLQSGMKSERDAAMAVLRYMVTTLGESGCRKAAMTLLCDGNVTKPLLDLLGVDAMAWLQMNASYATKNALLDVIRASKTEHVTPLLEYVRLRLDIEYQIPDAEAHIEAEAARERQEREEHITKTAFKNVERRLGRA